MEEGVAGHAVDNVVLERSLFDVFSVIALVSSVYMYRL